MECSPLSKDETGHGSSFFTRNSPDKPCWLNGRHYGRGTLPPPWNAAMHYHCNTGKPVMPEDVKGEALPNTWYRYLLTLPPAQFPHERCFISIVSPEAVNMIAFFQAC